jgi:UDP-glucose 4-epimerase
MARDGLNVAVTGPTGDLGIAIVNALERSRSVARIEGMARRVFDPDERGWKKTRYRQGDVTDGESVRDLVKGAHVVVHLAFAILTASDATRELNVAGSRRVFEEAAKAGVERICYASSVAAYGFHDDNPDWLTEEVPPRGSPESSVSWRTPCSGAGARWPTPTDPASSPDPGRARCSRRSRTTG